MQRGFGHVDIRNFRIEKPHQQPHQPALGLPLFAEKQHVVPGDQGDVDLGNDRAVVADDAGKQLVAVAEHAEKIVVNFAFDGFGNPTAGPKVAQVGRLFGR